MVCGCNKESRNARAQKEWESRVMFHKKHTVTLVCLAPACTFQICFSVSTEYCTDMSFRVILLSEPRLEQSRFPLCYGTWSRGLVRSVPPFRKHVLHPSAENFVLNPYEPQISHRNWGVTTVCRLILRTLFFSEYGGSKFVRKLSRHLPSCKASCAIRPNVHVFRISNLTK
jgi:hypothetical protein